VPVTGLLEHESGGRAVAEMAAIIRGPDNPADNEPVNVPRTSRGAQTDTHGLGGRRVPWNRIMSTAMMDWAGGIAAKPTSSMVLRMRAVTAIVFSLLIFILLVHRNRI
jgi:hypothetical protein